MDVQNIEYQHQHLLSILYFGIPSDVYEVAIAGSLALYLYMTHVLGTAVAWNPGDCDVYVCCPEADYYALVTKFEKYLKTNKIKYTVEPFTDSRYAGADNPLVLRNIHIEGLPYVSLIHVTKHKTVRAVVRDFDIDVCQIALYFKHNQYAVEPGALAAINTGKASVTRLFVWKTKVPTEGELAILMSTYRRVTKYENRGFSFIAKPRVTSVTKDGVRFLRDHEISAELTLGDN